MVILDEERVEGFLLLSHRGLGLLILLLQHHDTPNTRETGHFLLANVYTCLSSLDF